MIPLYAYIIGKYFTETKALECYKSYTAVINHIPVCTFYIKCFTVIATVGMEICHLLIIIQ